MAPDFSLDSQLSSARSELQRASRSRDDSRAKLEHARTLRSTADLRTLSQDPAVLARVSELWEKSRPVEKLPRLARFRRAKPAKELTPELARTNLDLLCQDLLSKTLAAEREVVSAATKAKRHELTYERSLDLVLQNDAEYVDLDNRVTAAQNSLTKALAVAAAEAIRAQVNDALQAQYAMTWVSPETPGLASHTESFIANEAYRQIHGLIARNKGVSIGVSGARGAGKSTILRVLYEEARSQGAAAVHLAAPVDYDPREFVLHTFAETCLAAGAEEVVPVPPIQLDAEQRRKPAILQALFVTAAAVALGGAGIRLHLETVRDPRVGAIGLAIAGMILLVQLGAFLSAHPKPSPVALLLTGALPGGCFVAVAARTPDSHAVLGFTVATAATLLGLVAAYAFRLIGPRRLHATARQVTDSPRIELAAGACAVLLLAATVVGVDGSRRAQLGLTWLLLACAVAGLALAWQYTIQNRDVIGITTTTSHTQRGPVADPLVARATSRLHEIRYQQTLAFAAGRSASLSAGLGPVAAELSEETSRETSSTRHPLTFPEIVHEYRAFLALAAADEPVLVCIDELDKMNAGEAERFLNGLKSVFGVDNCSFVVSVSEEAAREFERRSTFRTVFDSSFDDVVTVAPMDFRAARRFGEMRVIGLPVTAVLLAHLIAGGLPRELLRVLRVLTPSLAGQTVDTRAAVEHMMMQRAVELRLAAMSELAKADLEGTAVLDVLVDLDPTRGCREIAEALLSVPQSDPARRSPQWIRYAAFTVYRGTMTCLASALTDTAFARDLDSDASDPTLARLLLGRQLVDASPVTAARIMCEFSTRHLAGNQSVDQVRPIVDLNNALQADHAAPPERV
jgi:hypothetical protein